MTKAYSFLTVKSLKETDDAMTVEGIASTPTTDRVGDIVEPLGAKFKPPIPLFLHHDAQKQVGNVVYAKPTKDGIPFRAQIPFVKEAGLLQDMVNEARHRLKYGLMPAVSIGFNPEEGSIERLKTGGLRIKSWDWLELSLVSIPANPDAVITGVKSFDTALRAASGTKQSTPPPGVSGTPKQPASSGFFYARNEGNKVKTLDEALAQRATNAARMAELLEIKSAESRKFSDEERNEFDSLAADIEDLDDEIRVKKFHQSNIATARPVQGKSAEAGSASRGRGPTVFARKQDPEDKFQGQGFTRMVIARAAAHAFGSTPSAIAEYRWGKTHPNLVSLIKANEVAGGGTGSGEWGSELVTLDGRYTGDFIEFLYGATAFDKLPFREIPANVIIKGQDGGATGYWVGESKAIPVTKPDYMNVSLTPLKVGSLSVVSNDLLRYSTPAAEQLVADALREANAKRVDQTVFSNAAAVSGVSPAGLLNGLSAVATTGTDQAAVLALINALYAPFQAALNASDLWFVMNPAQAKAMSMLVTALGQPAFPNITSQGGTLLGDRVIVGDNIDASQIIVLKPTDIYKIGDTGVEVSVSRDATIEQRSDPTGATDVPTNMTTNPITNMFQEDSTAIKVIRHINFAKRRSSAVAYTDTADFQGTAS